MNVKSIPEEYPVICSGLGEARPNELLIVPICLNNQLLGVLELASFHSFKKVDMELMEKVSESVAIALNSTISRIRLADALKQTRQQADTLEEQQEQLRRTNEELEEQTAILKLSELNLQQQQEELRFVNGELEERNRLLDNQKEEIERKNGALERSRKELQAKARQLELSGQYKSEFLSTMSHELRTPLNSILILSQALSDKKNRNMTDRQIEHAKVIHSSGNDLLLLINDILDLSKVEEGKLELVSDRIVIADFLEKMRWQFKAQAEEKNIEFNFLIEDGAPVEIINDEHRLGQIIRNFISNAFKFTENGTVSIQVSIDHTNTIKQKSADQIDMMVFRVIDTGIGIPEDKLDLIFEAFQQVDGTISRKYGGTGLGLTISRKLALLMGGDVSVQSDGEGEGAVFSLTIPKKIVNAKPGRQTVARLRGPSKERRKRRSHDVVVDKTQKIVEACCNVVLIIEDDPGFSRVLKNLAEEYGFTAECVHTVSDAKESLEQRLPGSIILDLGLPDAPGEHLLSQLIASERTQNIPVHVISGKANISLDDLNGAKEFIEKPFGRARLDQLFSNIRREMSFQEVRRVLLVNDDAEENTALLNGLSQYQIVCETACLRNEIDSKLQAEFYSAVVVSMEFVQRNRFMSIKSLNELIQGRVPILLHMETSPDQKYSHSLNEFTNKIIYKKGKSTDRFVKEVIEGIQTFPLQQEHPENSKGKELDSRVSDFNVVKQKAPTPSRAGDFLNKRILLVDDDIRNLYSLSAILEDAGFHVESATTGLEAMAMIRDSREYDLILMDIMMPEMDGLEAIRQIRLITEYQDIPIIALTAKAMQNDRRVCIEAGANDYMPKPVDSSMLKENVGMWINRTELG